MAIQRTFRKKIFLDTLFSRSTTENSNHFIGSSFKAYKVLATNNKAFDLEIVADYESGAVEGIPVGQIRLHNYGQKPNTAVLENKVIQAGVWVLILFSVDDELVYTGEDVGAGSDAVISEGTNFNMAKIEVATNTVVEVFPANDQRALGVLQLKTGGTFWYGNPSELNHANWKDICRQVTLSPLDTFEWRKSAAMNIKTDAGPIVFSREQGIK